MSQADARREARSLFDVSRERLEVNAREPFTGRPRSAKARAAKGSGQSPILRNDVLRAVFELAPSGATVSSPDLRWLAVNDAYCRMLGYERSELVGASCLSVTHPDDLAGDREFNAALLADKIAPREREKRYLRKDGSTIWTRVHVAVIFDEINEPLCYVCHVEDVTERRAAQHLLDDSERTLRSVIDNIPAVVYVKGADHRYRLVNDEFERMFGVSSEWIVGRSDAELVPAATLADVRAKDALVLGGQQLVPEEELMPLSGQERVMVRTRFPLMSDMGEINALCVMLTDVTEHRLEEHLKRDRLQCSELIYSALAQDRFVLHGQPIIHLASNKPAKVELLVRMLKARGEDELLLPSMFLPEAERFDLITIIDEWVIDQALELAAAGHRVTVNVSAKTISDPAQVTRIEAAVLDSGAPPDNLIFEITETAVADNLEAARSFAIRMRTVGSAIALDDFGVGHGSFTYLRHLPIDYLKIDMQFVRDLVSDEDDRQVVEAIIGVAQQYKIETIAEGVEDQATLKELRRIGVDYAQGYWLGHPAPPSQNWNPPRNRRRSDTSTVRS